MLSSAKEISPLSELITIIFVGVLDERRGVVNVAESVWGSLRDWLSEHVGELNAADAVTKFEEIGDVLKSFEASLNIAFDDALTGRRQFAGVNGHERLRRLRQTVCLFLPLVNLRLQAKAAEWVFQSHQVGHIAPYQADTDVPVDGSLCDPVAP